MAALSRDPSGGSQFEYGSSLSSFKFIIFVYLYVNQRSQFECGSSLSSLNFTIFVYLHKSILGLRIYVNQTSQLKYGSSSLSLNFIIYDLVRTKCHQDLSILTKDVDMFILLILHFHLHQLCCCTLICHQGSPYLCNVNQKSQ